MFRKVLMSRSSIVENVDGLLEDLVDDGLGPSMFKDVFITLSLEQADSGHNISPLWILWGLSRLNSF